MRINDLTFMVAWTINKAKDFKMASNIKLTVRAGFKTGLEKEFETDLLTIGRDPKNLMVIDDIEVSRNHAIIRRMVDGFYVEDLNSTNGTFLNGRSVNKPEKIENGDLITLGESVVLVLSIPTEITSEEEILPEESLVLDYSDATIERDGLPKEKVEEPEKKPIVMVDNKKLNLLERFPTWVIILIVAFAFLVIFCFIPFIVIELTNQWCNLFSGFFNVLSPGACP